VGHAKASSLPHKTGLLGLDRLHLFLQSFNGGVMIDNFLRRPLFQNLSQMMTL
jgi:hypothetical protein